MNRGDGPPTEAELIRAATLGDTAGSRYATLPSIAVPEPPDDSRQYRSRSAAFSQSWRKNRGSFGRATGAGSAASSHEKTEVEPAFMNPGIRIQRSGLTSVRPGA